jgi:hypothetical protein
LLGGVLDTLRRYLEADYLDVGANPGKALVEFEGRHPTCAVAEVDHKRIVGPAKRREGTDEAVDPAQAVRVRCSPGDLADRHGTI